MLEELLRHNNLGGKREIAFLLFHCLKKENPRRISDVRAFSISNIFTSAISFDGIVSLLRFLEFVELHNEYLNLNTSAFDPASFDSENYFQGPHFYKALFQKLSKETSGANFLNRENVRFDHSRNSFYVRSHLIAFRFLSLRNLLLRLGFFHSDDSIPNHLFIPPKFSKLLKRMFVDLIQKEDQERRLSIVELKARLKAKEELGKKGEMFVLDFEKNRLANHPSVTDVSRISEDYVNAGYDIESFENEDSIVSDRFIEVKTYANEISFYWSSNEIESAERLRNDYWIYLVHAGSIEDVDYSPLMFRNPATTILQNDLWARESTSWKFTYLDQAS